MSKFSSAGLWWLGGFLVAFKYTFLNNIFSLFYLQTLQKFSSKFSLTLKHHSKISSEVFGYFSEIEDLLN